MVVALCFLATLLLATLTTRGLAEIDWDDLTEAAPAVLCALAMPLTFSIAHGIAFGFIACTITKLLAGRFRDVSFGIVVIARVLIAKFIRLA